MNVPADVAALVRAGFLEEVRPGVFRRPRMPSRADLYGEQPTTPNRTAQHLSHPRGTRNDRDRT